MRSHSIAALLRRVDRLLARAAKAREEMESAKAESDERAASSPAQEGSGDAT